LGNVAIGVDFGNHSVKFARVRRQGQQLLIERLAKIPRPSAEESLAINAGLRETGLKVAGGIMGVSGRGAILRYTSVPPVPAFRLKMIMEYEIGELAGKSTEAVSSDYKVLNIPREVSQDFTVMVAMSKDEYIRGSISQLADAGAPVTQILPTPLALYNSFVGLGLEEEGRTCLLVDLGATNTDIAVLNGRDLYFARSIGRGADEFTEAISEGLGVGFPEAERIKAAEGYIARTGWATDREKAISDALTGAADRLHATLNSSVNFAQRQLKLKNLKIEKVFLFGGGSNLPGLNQHLAGAFGLEVVIPNLLSQFQEAGEAGAAQGLAAALPAEDIAGSSPELREYSAAIGLALSAMGHPYYSMDLVPAEEKKRRAFKERTIFLYIAGALLAAFLLVRLVASGLELAAAEDRKAKLDERLEEAQQRLFDLKKLNSDNDQLTASVEHLARKTEPGTFMTQLIFATRRREVTPAEIKITDAAMRKPFSEEGKPVRAVSAIIGGVVKSQTGNEYGVVRKFRDQLLSTDIVKSAKIDPTRTTDVKGEFRFVIEVSSGRLK
jgi:type IV pilus assembly protein PilM